MTRFLLLVIAAAFIEVCSTASAAPQFPSHPAASANRLPGVELAEGLTQLTGVAISPLLGVTAVGAWQYWRAPESIRSRLPWYCHPLAWGLGFTLLGLCFLKDLFGAAAPPLLKKPLDVLELLENKLSAIVACSAFLPFVVSQMSRTVPPEALLSPPNSTVQVASMLGVAGMDAHWLIWPFAVIGFLTVWLACHAINVLIVLCPFGFIDALLKLLKVALLSLVVASAFISPLLGATVSLVILFVAGLVAPWAFRLTVFGSVFGLDVMLPHRAQGRASLDQPRAFLLAKAGSAPARSYGRVLCQPDGALSFAYRPWLVLPERKVALLRGDLAIAKGILYPSLVARAASRQLGVLAFPPRYRGHEQPLAAKLSISETCESPAFRGFRAMRGWVSQMLRPGASIPRGTAA